MEEDFRSVRSSGRERGGKVSRDSRIEGWQWTGAGWIGVVTYRRSGWSESGGSRLTRGMFPAGLGHGREPQHPSSTNNPASKHHLKTTPPLSSHSIPLPLLDDPEAMSTKNQYPLTPWRLSSLSRIASQIPRPRILHRRYRPIPRFLQDQAGRLSNPYVMSVDGVHVGVRERRC